MLILLLWFLPIAELSFGRTFGSANLRSLLCPQCGSSSSVEQAEHHVDPDLSANSLLWYTHIAFPVDCRAPLSFCVSAADIDKSITIGHTRAQRRSSCKGFLIRSCAGIEARTLCSKFEELSLLRRTELLSFVSLYSAISAGPVLIFAGVSYLLPLLLPLTTVSFPRITYLIVIIFLGCNVFVVTQAQERLAALGVLRGLMGSGSMMNLLRSIQLLYLSPITSQSPKQRRYQDTRGRSIYQNRDVTH